MSPRSFGLVGPRSPNPVGKTGIFAGLLIIIEAVLSALDAEDVSWQTIVQAVLGALLAGYGERVRRQEPEYRDPNHEG